MRTKTFEGDKTALIKDTLRRLSKRPHKDSQKFQSNFDCDRDRWYQNENRKLKANLIKMRKRSSFIMFYS